MSPDNCALCGKSGEPPEPLLGRRARTKGVSSPSSSATTRRRAVKSNVWEMKWVKASKTINRRTDRGRDISRGGASTKKEEEEGKTWLVYLKSGRAWREWRESHQKSQALARRRDQRKQREKKFSRLLEEEGPRPT